MRKKEEIKQQAENTMKTEPLVIEILLDIRELLQGALKEKKKDE